MSYFLPSFLQKRLLRYALSRIELVDTDALDLDSLGIKWGQRSTFELRDLGLRLEKLSSALQLPSTCDLTKAKVSLVRVTIPADIYNSGIIVEAEGIHVHLKVLPETNQPDSGEASKHGKPGGQDASTIIPSTTDLAQSFLDSEPREETEELQAALSSKSQHLQQPDALSDDSDDDVGLQENMSLPSFLAGFFKGVLDRLQLKISDVTLRIDMELPRDGPSRHISGDGRDHITGMLTLRDIAIDGVATETVEDARLKMGKRLATLSEMHFALVADPSVFDSYSRFHPPATPSLSRTETSNRGAPSPQPSTSDSGSYHAMAQSTMFEGHAFYEGRSQILGDSAYSQGRFSDAATEHEYGPEDFGFQSMAGSRDEEMFLENPAYLDEALQYEDDIENSTGKLSPPLARGGDSSESHPEEDPLHSTAAERNHSAPSPSLSFRSSRTETHSDPRQSSTNSTSGRIDNAEGQGVDDLSQSKIFTHEEAQSMYMSAMSHASDSSLPQMPGAWGSSRSSSTLMERGHLDPTPEAEQPEPISSNDDAGASTPKASSVIEQEHVGEERIVEGHNVSNLSRDQHEDEDGHQSAVDISGLVKTVLDVENITLWIPSFEDEVREDTVPELPKQSSDQLKESTLSFGESVMSDAGSSRFRMSSSFLGRQPNIPGRAEDVFEGLSEGEASQAVEIDVGEICIRFDISCGWLLARMGQKFQAIWKPSSSEGEMTEQKNAVTSPPVAVSLATCHLKFLEHLPGKVYGHAALHNPSTGVSHEDVILRVDLSGIDFSTVTAGRKAKYCLKVAKFAFGHASEDVISFDDSLGLQESTRDLTAPARGDIFVSVTTSPIISEMHLTTLPLRILINLQQFDETIAWFGGLSTVLELGSSVASISTVRDRKDKPPKLKTKPKGVHFERIPPEKSGNHSNGVPMKVNCRIAGLAIEVAGEKCSLKLDTSAVKIASRFGVQGIFVQRGTMTGPHRAGSGSHPLPSVNFKGFKLEYRSEPNEGDLDRMLKVLTPSQDKTTEEDDDIMLDTLVRQRKKGGLLNLTFANVNVHVPHLSLLAPLSTLGDELARLSTVARYIPQDDTPGIMTLTLVRELEGEFYLGKEVGTVDLLSENFEACHVSFPSLIAMSISKILVGRNGDEELIGETIPQDSSSATAKDKLPMVMVRYIADEMEPTVKLKLFNLRAEYTVPCLTAFLGLSSEMSAEDIAANMAHSVVNLAELKPRHGDSSDVSTQSSAASNAGKSTMPSRLSVIMTDCLLGLNPRHSPAKGLVVFTSARFFGSLNEDEPSEASLQVQKASLVIIDDVENIDLTGNVRGRKSSTQNGLVRTLEGMGFVPICSTSAARVVVKIMQLEADGEKSLDVELKDDLLILETCADSTQTLITIMNGLAPPTPPNRSLKYRTEVMPIEDMLNSFSGNAFAAGSSADSGDAGVDQLSPIDEDEADKLEYVSDFHPAGSDKSDDGFEELLGSFHSEAHVSSSVSELEFQEDHFAKKSAVGGRAHRWDSTRNTYNLSNELKLHGSPLRVRVRDVHVIWNLFDGYDWQRTRDAISKAVHNVQSKAAERRTRASPAEEDEEESVIGDFLFNSVYIGIPTNRDPRELSHEINRNIDDLVSDTGSFATSTTVTVMPSHPSNPKREKLRLARSKHHKMTFELKGIAADMVIFPPGSGETQSSLDVRIRDLEIFDHLPTSTWKKFATYMRDAGEREIGANMAHLEILNVRPVAELAASELIVKVTVLPLRLHVDQDALDFLSRFFEFKDDSVPVHPSDDEIPFIQRAEVNAVPVKLDFKPKRVDYGGLRSGRTTEFMNFFVLDEAQMVLRHVIIYGVSGFDRLGQTLNDIWMPDIKANQLPNILAGLAPVKSIVSIGSGFKDLVVIPMREYKKDGRIVRSIQKGAVSFAKTTTNELVKFGAKLAIGTQTVLQNAEDFLNHPGGMRVQQGPATEGQEDDPIDEDEKKQISLYADQPVGVVQGLRGAFSSLERDIIVARDAIVAVPGEVMESGSAKGAAKVLWKRAPTVILRPAIGASKAVGQTLLGAGNTLDPKNRSRIEDKYKRH